MEGLPVALVELFGVEADSHYFADLVGLTVGGRSEKAGNRR